jgi:anti-anti-sigma regulatory factor
MTCSTIRTAAVLRITRTNPGEAPAILKLEGRLTGPWVAELERVVALSTSPGTRVVLRMEAVTYADTAGAALLKRLVRRTVDVGPVSSFVGALLERKSDEYD